jgi:anti-sigma28 factor (negative regulator of flagellin synthesis)
VYSQEIQKNRVNTTEQVAAPNNTKIDKYRDEINFTGEAIKVSNEIRSESSTANIRFDLVNRVKSEIAAGNYDTPDKMDIAIDRMIEKLNLI